VNNLNKQLQSCASTSSGTLLHKNKSNPAIEHVVIEEQLRNESPVKSLKNSAEEEYAQIIGTGRSEQILNWAEYDL
jgi:hypothetical protein